MILQLITLLSIALVGMDEPPTKLDEALRAELHAMVRADQDARQKMIAWMQKHQETDAAKVKQQDDVPEVKTVQELDKKHTARLKEIVDKHGWPGKSLVGKDGAHDAWLLVQHADLDRAFQKRCLELIEAAAKRNEVSKQDLAYLTDRVLVGEGKKQVYGTQFKTENGELVPQPIEDEADVDKRRAEVGLSTLAEYKKLMLETYKPKAKDK